MVGRIEGFFLCLFIFLIDVVGQSLRELVTALHFVFIIIIIIFFSFLHELNEV